MSNVIDLLHFTLKMGKSQPDGVHTSKRRNMIRRPILNIMIAMLCLATAVVFGQTVDVTGELSASVTTNDAPGNPVYANARYTPEIFIDYSFWDSNSIGLRASADLTSATLFKSFDDAESEADADVYRLWLRVSASQWEARIGKQKLNFGAATLLRPLMWFDSIDPRDPLQRSDGVWGFLARYYFVNNVNIWAWGLLGNDKPKGWEAIPTDEKKAEYGGRIQVPVPYGEAGASYHRRTADASRLLAAAPAGGGASANPSANEDRFGFDAKWDIGVGGWIEGALYHQDGAYVPEPYQSLMTAGLDYTFAVGDGLTVLGEHFLAVAGTEAFSGGTQNNMSGLSFTYPWGLVDNLGMIIYYDHDAGEFYRFFDWRRRYDRWSFHAIGFINPESTAFLPIERESNLLQGSGLQILIVFDH
jgi:hypothetical protein